MNNILKIRDKTDFTNFKLGEKLETPPYFKQMELYNRNGPPLSDLPNPPPLTLGELKKYYDSAQIVDVRSLKLSLLLIFPAVLIYGRLACHYSQAGF
ncbi:MAG: hypothetical protein OdinLCB4_000785 [Candidatus Odinarchaeum yellowstonii]|uniref:Uncharacterized protein n=1 Tax=Odinarchaeota yellowstonii (strain LCB_4) TaxID=1841599 RepID=A0AAF0D2I8_ODILC|nr:MAG: hypothetical protein OdinLCB4_000785 [Candidatus Odinarchaeum yellowstonii]